MPTYLRRQLGRAPILGPLTRRLIQSWKLRKEPFEGSATYWDREYRLGRTSGRGSYGLLAQFKAEVLNDFVERNGVRSIIEYGCGDGNQLSLAHYPQYIGIDVSPTAIDNCRRRFANDPTKSFHWHDPQSPTGTPWSGRCDMSMSLDVIYHLVEDDVFDSYMQRLFDSADRYVVVYSTCRNAPSSVPWVRHRQFTDWIAQHRPQWSLVRTAPNRHPELFREVHLREYPDFYFYRAPAG